MARFQFEIGDRRFEYVQKFLGDAEIAHRGAVLAKLGKNAQFQSKNAFEWLFAFP